MKVFCLLILFIGFAAVADAQKDAVKMSENLNTKVTRARDQKSGTIGTVVIPKKAGPPSRVTGPRVIEKPIIEQMKFDEKAK